MSLHRKMIILVALCIFCFSAIVMVTIAIHDRGLIENKLRSSANSSAKFLALTISKNIDFEDKKSIEELLNFELGRGFYQNLTLKDIDGSIISSVKSQHELKAPFWISSTIDMKNLIATSQIMKDDINIGSIKVVVDENYALNSLYKSIKTIFYIFCIFIVVSLLIIYFYLKKLLNSFKNINRQAQAIDSNQYLIVEDKPAAAEFADITNAMNKSIKKLKRVFSKEIDIFRKYNRLLYTDDEFSIGNRRFMMLKLEEYLKCSFGCFLFIEILNRAKLKNALGYINFSSFNTFVINNCDDIFGSNKNFIVAKLNEETLAILLPYQEYKDIKNKIEEFYISINNHIDHTKLNQFYKIDFAIGVTNYAENESISDLLTKTDESLKQAIQKEDKKINFIHSSKNFKHENKILFSVSLAQNAHVEFEKIGVYDTQTEKFDLIEYLPRLSMVNDKDSYSCRLIMGISDSNTRKILQKHILENFFKSVKTTSVKQHISIKLVKEFAVDKDSVNWLYDTLYTKFKDGKIKFYFECLNKDIHSKRKDFEHLVKILRECRHEFAVESYAFENNNFEYLKILHPKYIKISKSYILHDINNISKDILENITSALDSKLIIKNVDDESDFLKLEELQLTNLQGRFLKLPK